MRRIGVLIGVVALLVPAACRTQVVVNGGTTPTSETGEGPATTVKRPAKAKPTTSSSTTATASAGESTAPSSTRATNPPTSPPTVPAPVIPADQLASLDDQGVSDLRIVEPVAVPAAQVDPASCNPVWTSPPPKGTAEVTFVVGDTMWSVTPDGANPVCLLRTDQSFNEAAWKPTGDQLLVNGTTIIDARGSRPNGLTATTGVEWSRPTGKALIVPSPDARELTHVQTDDPTDIVNIAALAETWQAIYYPSGLSVIASGVASDGVAGLFLASNVGEIRRPIATLNDADSRITDMSVLPDGSGVMFIHDHRHVGEDTTAHGDANGVLSHVHLLTLPDLKFEDLAALHHSVASNIVTAMDGTTQASFGADASTIGSTTGIWYRFPDQYATPVGMDAFGNTFALVRTSPDAPGELWKLPTNGPDVPATTLPTLLATNVSHAMVRQQQGKYRQLPDEIEAQAPG